MPQLVTFRVARRGRRTIRVWVPVLPVVLVLSPVLMLAVAGGVVACRMYRVSATGALTTLWRIICALPGARFEIAEGHMALLVIIR